MFYQIGRCIGTTSAQSDHEAFTLMLAAAKQGHIKAQYNVGKMYEFGRGTTQSYEQAAKWFLDAAEHGMAPAAYSVGILYRKGLGVAQSDEKAQKWYETASKNGMTFAQLRAYNKHKEDRYNNDLVNRGTQMNRKYKTPNKGPILGNGRIVPNWEAAREFQNLGEGSTAESFKEIAAKARLNRLNRQQELLKRESQTT
jgi:TPR repeat protein